MFINMNPYVSALQVKVIAMYLFLYIPLYTLDLEDKCNLFIKQGIWISFPPYH